MSFNFFIMSVVTDYKMKTDPEKKSYSITLISMHGLAPCGSGSRRLLSKYTIHQKLWTFLAVGIPSRIGMHCLLLTCIQTCENTFGTLFI